jgi:ribosome-associated protein
MARMAADAIFERKGADIVLLDIEGLFILSDIFVIATGTSRPHVQALSEYVEEKLKDNGIVPLRVEGHSQGEWILVDYGDIIVHLFQGVSREFYSLERLWGDAERIQWEEPAVSDS